MKYKAGDKVKIKSFDWYNANKDEYGVVLVENGDYMFCKSDIEWCGKIVTIAEVCLNEYYRIVEDFNKYRWTDDMIEGLVEEETKPKFGTALNPIEPKSNANCLTMERVDAIATKIDKELPSGNQNVWELPDGYRFIDENGNEILTSKIILEKKEVTYPKTYEECCEILGGLADYVWGGYKQDLFQTFHMLYICRDAYWKLYGEEMGLGKPWENGRYEVVYSICRDYDDIVKQDDYWGGAHIFEFPIREMRDAFYENFNKEIEICKKLL